jgi:hypothetical protein
LESCENLCNQSCQAVQAEYFANSYAEKYNVASNNCTTFAVDLFSNIGLKAPAEEHRWTLSFASLPFYKRAVIRIKGWDTVANNIWGYSPADAGEDLKAWNSQYIGVQDGLLEETFHRLISQLPRKKCQM